MHNDRLFDKRVIKRNIKKKLVSPKDLESFKKGLDDDSSRLEIINVDNELDDEMPKADDYKE